MVFMSLEFFSENKCYLILPVFFLFFVYLLPGFIKKRSHNAKFVFEEGAIEHILRAIVWLYGFESVFLQNLTVNLNINGINFLMQLMFGVFV